MLAYALAGAITVLAAGTSPATAAPAPTPAPAARAAVTTVCLHVCEEEVTTVAQRECYAREREAAQAALDQTIAALESAHPPSGGEPYDKDVLAAFRPAQDAWTAYVEAQCHAVGVTWSDGSGRLGAVQLCLLDHIRDRNHEIWVAYHLEDLPEPKVLCAESRPD
jgi:uncharacterized protein YecT (DUF1311 family)